MSDHQTRYGLVEVQPFCHQVGGHTCVLQLNDRIICKPFVENEVTFYTNEPDELKEFTPKYLGETEVLYDVSDDRKCLLAQISSDLMEEEGLHFVDSSDDVTCQPLLPKRNRKRSRNSSDEDTLKALKRGCSQGLAVWSRSCIERQITRYGFWANNQPQKFIMLENLVYNYSHPCLMDLKMGRRQFGNDSSAEKRKLLAERCAHSTSATLGYRINGSQVYKSSNHQYVFHDKYFGRELDDSGAVEELYHFFHNGFKLRCDVIQELINKLNRLESYLSYQHVFNFFSCSLLLIYDADNKSIESGKCIHCAERCTGNENDNEANAHDNDISDPVAQNGRDRMCGCRDMTSCQVDVRLIDFAHVCKRTDKEQMDGLPDETIVFGLRKLRDGLCFLLSKQE